MGFVNAGPAPVAAILAVRRINAMAAELPCQPLIRGHEIVDGLADLRRIDWRTIKLDHLRHFGLPEILLSISGHVAA
jgi:hypothetical protein